MFKIASSGWCGMAIAILFTLLILPSQSQASLSQDLAITGDNLSGLGFIEFTSESSDTGEVANFSYEGVIGEHSWSCDGIGCFDTEPTWEINNLWGFSVLELWISQVVDEYTFTLGIVFEDSTGYATGTYANGGALYGPFTGIVINTHGEIPVSEPSTLAIFGLGLAGLGFFMTRRRRVV